MGRKPGVPLESRVVGSVLGIRDTLAYMPVHTISVCLRVLAIPNPLPPRALTAVPLLAPLPVLACLSFVPSSCLSAALLLEALRFLTNG